MTENKQKEVQILEQGNIYFFYRPKVDKPSVEGLEDVERFYMVLEPKQKDKHLYRLIIIGQKKMPEIKPHGGRYSDWGFVDKVSQKAEEVEDELDAKTYRTKTRGEQTREPARPVSEGLYNIVCHQDHTHLVYVLNLPRQIGEVQKALQLGEEGSYILSIKNPHQPAPGQVGLRGKEPRYPEDLEKKLGKHKWIPADPPSFLDYEGTQILLIGAESDASEELGIDLQPQSEKDALDAIVNDLRLELPQHPLAPLFKGQWQ
ncbi:MAG TPA: hypothetical protein VHZ51_18455 [Ktedonobacteraceae bacterium]|nr:hypothetical protein [Ktedonobacteraceae bacterium]